MKLKSGNFYSNGIDTYRVTKEDDTEHGWSGESVLGYGIHWFNEDGESILGVRDYNLKEDVTHWSLPIDNNP